MAKHSDLDQLARQVQGDAGCASSFYGGCGFIGCGFVVWLACFIVLPFGTLLGVPAALLAGLVGALVGLRMAGASRRKSELAIRTALLAAGREDPLAPPTAEGQPAPPFDWRLSLERARRSLDPARAWLATATILGRPAWQWTAVAILALAGAAGWRGVAAWKESARREEAVAIARAKQRARDAERARAIAKELRYAPRKQRDGVEQFLDEAFGTDKDAVAAIEETKKHLRDRLPGKAAYAIERALRYTDLTRDAPARKDLEQMALALADFAVAINKHDPVGAAAALNKLPFTPNDRTLLVSWLEARARTSAALTQLRDAKALRPYDEERALDNHIRAAAAFGRAVRRTRNAIAKEDRARAVIALFNEQPPRSFEYESPVTGVRRKVSVHDKGTKRLIAEQELRDVQSEVRDAIAALPAYRGEASRLEVELWMEKQEGEGRRLETQFRQALAEKKLVLSHGVAIAEANHAAMQDAEWRIDPGRADWEPLVAALQPLYPKP